MTVDRMLLNRSDREGVADLLTIESFAHIADRTRTNGEREAAKDACRFQPLGADMPTIRVRLLRRQARRG